MREITIPISDDAIRDLHVGDTVHLTGVMVTGRDAAHKFMVENYIRQDPSPDNMALYQELKRLLDRSLIYHCGPVVKKDARGRWEFVAAGPTTSIREEVYQPDVISHFNLRGVIGKGGMGPKTLAACQAQPAVYFHAIGGAATLIAQSVKSVEAVHKMEFGVPEAMWVIRVEKFPVVVTMDCHGQSIHDSVASASEEKLKQLLAI